MALRRRTGRTLPLTTDDPSPLASPSMHACGRGAAGRAGQAAVRRGGRRCSSAATGARCVLWRQLRLASQQPRLTAAAGCRCSASTRSTARRPVRPRWLASRAPMMAVQTICAASRPSRGRPRRLLQYATRLQSTAASPGGLARSFPGLGWPKVVVATLASSSSARLDCTAETCSTT